VDPGVWDGATAFNLNPQALMVDEALFPLAAVSGSPTPHSAITVIPLTRDLDANAINLERWVWRPGNAPQQIQLVTRDPVEITEGDFARAEIKGLAPGTRYHFAVFALDEEKNPISRSTIGSFMTAWGDDWIWPITMAATTCTNWGHRPYKALSLMAQSEFDLLLHLGDMSYNDSADSLEAYRERWRTTLDDPGYRDLLPQSGMLITWDDHEITNDLNPETVSEEKMAAAKESFFEALPMNPGPQGQLWQSFRWGLTAEIIILDCRTERKPSTLKTPGQEEYMSREQMDFFKARLKESPCHFKIVMNSVPASRFPESFWANQGDRWQGYEASRDEIMNFMADEGIENVWFLSGDFHLGFVCRVEAEGPLRHTWEVAVGPGANDGNPLPWIAEQVGNIDEVFPRDQFIHYNAEKAATFLTFDPIEDEVHILFVDAETEDVLFKKTLKASD
jgi:alkaline phosphatase D